MLKKRIIPCLDVHEGRTVKGTNFINLKDAGDPVELGSLYALTGADELVYLDISASLEGRNTFLNLVSKVAEKINIPFTVGGGINDRDSVNRLLQAGADKVSINSSALDRPELIDEIAGAFGSQCLVVAIDARQEDGLWKVYSHGGKKPVNKELFAWASEVENRGAGEILFTSMDHDGTRNGYAIESLKKLQALSAIPVIASGGAGNMHHFAEVFRKTDVSAALAAGIFHYGILSIEKLKTYLKDQNIEVR